MLDAVAHRGAFDGEASGSPLAFGHLPRASYGGDDVGLRSRYAPGFEAAIPYNRHLGLEVAEVGEGRGVITLPDDDRLHNHVGSQHAGALFSAGEAASGAAFMGAFAEHLGDITPLARSAEISYLKLAKGPITATGTLGREGGAAVERSTPTGRWSSRSRWS